jgi:hypothetical protein
VQWSLNPEGVELMACVLCEVQPLQGCLKTGNCFPPVSPAAIYIEALQASDVCQLESLNMKKIKRVVSPLHSTNSKTNFALQRLDKKWNGDVD